MISNFVVEILEVIDEELTISKEVKDNLHSNILPIIEFIYNAGYDKGEEQGYENGYSNSYSEGFNDGKSEGYTEGFEEGYKDAEENIILNSNKSPEDWL